MTSLILKEILVSIHYTVLEYLKIEHQETRNIMDDFFEKQKTNSKLLVHSGEKDRTLFFNKMHLKVNKLRDQIIVSKSYDLD